jgi:hypothetical protein
MSTDQRRVPKGDPRGTGGQFTSNPPKPVGDDVFNEKPLGNRSLVLISQALWEKAGFTLDDAEDWSFFAFTPYRARKWADAGFDATHAYSWQEWGLSPIDARRWHDAGFTDLHYDPAGPWFNTRNLSLEEAKEWRDAGFNHAQALSWLEAEISLERAIRDSSRWGSTSKFHHRPEMYRKHTPQAIQMQMMAHNTKKSQWNLLGFSNEAAREWEKSRINPFEAAELRSQATDGDVLYGTRADYE